MSGRKQQGRTPARGATSPAKRRVNHRQPPPGEATPLRSLPQPRDIKVKSRGPREETTRVRPVAFAYADEVIAIFLVAVGLIFLLSLLSPESGAWAETWGSALRWAFGVGAFAIPIAVLVGGALILLPKLGIPVRFDGGRVVAAEIFFVALLACIHANIRAQLGGEPGRMEAFSAAMEGRGGGFVGWALQEAVHMLLGDTATGFVLLSALIISGAAMLAIGRRQLIGILAWLQGRAHALAYRLDDEGKVPAPPSLAGPGGAASEARYYEASGADPFAPSYPGDAGVLELPPIPGRPSIITGSVGAGSLVSRPTGPLPARISIRRRRGDSPAPDAEKPVIRHRFKVTGPSDKRRARKRHESLPPLDLLDDNDFGRPAEDEINTNAQIIEETVEDFGMRVEVVDVKTGPTVTQYAVSPITEVERNGKKIIERVRVTAVAGLARDLSLAMAAPSVRIQAPVPGTNYIGVEVPNARPGVVALRPIIESEQFYKESRSPLALALGRTVAGEPFAVDLSTMPHLLIGGTTGSGKSVCITAMAACLAINNRPDQLRLIMIDPKMVELVRFNGLPHLLGTVEVSLERIIGVLRWATREMDRRYRVMEEAQARNILTYNKGRSRKYRLPYIVIMIDELSDLMTHLPDETEHLICRLAQMARATGIHLVVATQRPSVDVVTGLIKANFPARISFAVPSSVDSRVILDTVGAESLVGRGDMLYQGTDAAGPIRLQGCFVSDAELERIVQHWRETWDHDEDAVAPWERSLVRSNILDETDDMIEEAIRLVQGRGYASASLIQRQLNVGYPRAARIADLLYDLGVVGPEEAGGKQRRVLIDDDVDPMTYLIRRRQAGRL
jgi:S-DNA-T family DNA segregation ATPase FtsK/SpoIIIE